MLLTGAQSEELVARAFRHAGVHHNMAKDAAVVLTMTEMMGIGTHGLARVPGYIERVLQGGVNPKALPQIFQRLIVCSGCSILLLSILKIGCFWCFFQLTLLCRVF